MHGVKKREMYTKRGWGRSGGETRRSQKTLGNGFRKEKPEIREQTAKKPEEIGNGWDKSPTAGPHTKKEKKTSRAAGKTVFQKENEGASKKV